MAVVVASVVGLDALQYALHSDARNFDWAGSTLSVVASGTTPAPVPVALAGALGAAAAVSVAVGAGGPGAPEAGTGNEGAAAAVVHVRMAPKRTGKGMLAALERATTPRLPNEALIF